MAGPEPDQAARAMAWAEALPGNHLPDFVHQRLGDAADGRLPWTSTMRPAELLAARSHGIRPIATVSGTCWFHYGYSWTEGHAEGWHKALARLRLEATACGANAIVDVRLRTGQRADATSMDFTVIGTAVRVEGLAPSPDPVIATVSTMEFVRLLEAGIVPVGVAIGAFYDWLTPSLFSPLAGGGFSNMRTQAWPELTQFWEYVRDQAIAALAADTQRLGSGVLAHTHFGEIIRQEGGGDDNNRQPPRYLARAIVLGTVVDTPPGADVPHDVRTVVDMRDDLSPLRRRAADRNEAYRLETEKDGAI